ncbi:unnamed protein product [Rotaria socialis]
MASAVSSTDKTNTNPDDSRLEIFSLLWLDANPKETRDTEQKLRSIINRLLKFQDAKKCQQYIEGQLQNDRIVMIVSGGLGREIVPNIYKLRQVISIYVYCMDKNGNKKWADKYSKVKAVVVELDELISRIKADYKIQKMVEEPLSINFFTGNSTAGIDGQFIFYQVLIDCLLRLKSTEKDKEELIHRCKKQYEGNSMELSNVNDFKTTYSSSKALWWYTRESFFYKTLNAALRTQDIHLIFLFRAFISDIQRQLNDESAKQRLHVYRSQMISSDELKTLKKSCGQLISVNSFFSTSTEYQKALSFLNVSNDTNNFEPILFEIDADPKNITSKPFADIRACSYFQDESEVLFMLGSIFRLNSINRSSDGQVWIIKMTLYSENEHDLKQVLMYMKQQLGSGETNLRILGKLLMKMGNFGQAEQYFTRLLKELPPNDPLLVKLYEDLGEVTAQAHKFNESMEWHKKLLALKNPNDLIDTSLVDKRSSSRVIPNLPANARWEQNGVTVVGHNGERGDTHTVCYPKGLYVDDDNNQTIVIADSGNSRIMQWKINGTNGKVVAGGNTYGNGLDKLCCPADVLIDKETNSLIISDQDNRRVVRWSRHHDTTQGEILIDKVKCSGLAIDEQRNLYVSDFGKHEVRRYEIDRQDKKGTLVAGGNGKGSGLNQLEWPSYIFVDRQQSVYVSDHNNDRVIKWIKNATEGVIVAGGQGYGKALTQLACPTGIFVDTLGTLYVAEGGDNHRVTRWLQGAKQGTVVVGENGEGKEANQFYRPEGLSFDKNGNLYIADEHNHRVQRFSRK